MSSNPVTYTDGDVTYTVDTVPVYAFGFQTGTQQNLTISYADGTASQTIQNISVLTGQASFTLGTIANVLNFSSYFIPPNTTTSLVLVASFLSSPTFYVGGNVTVASVGSALSGITFNVIGQSASLNLGAGLISLGSGATVNLSYGGTYQVGFGLVSALSGTSINFDQNGTGGTFIFNGGNNLINFGGQNAVINLSGISINNFDAAAGDRIEFKNVQGSITGYTVTNNQFFGINTGTQVITLYNGKNEVCGITINGTAVPTGTYTFGQSGPLAIQTQADGNNSDIFIDPVGGMMSHNNQSVITSQTVTGIQQTGSGTTINVNPNVALTVGSTNGVESINNSGSDIINVRTGGSIIDQGGLDNSNQGTISLASTAALSVGSTDPLNAINNSTNGTIFAGSGDQITDAGGLNNTNHGTINLTGSGSLSVSSNDPLNAINNSSYGTITAGNGEQITDAGGLDNSVYGTINLAGGGTLSVASTDPLNAINNSNGGTIIAGKGEVVTDAGGLNNSVGGVFDLSGSTANIAGEINNDGNGVINIDNGSTLTAGSIDGGTGTIAFQGTGNTLSVTPNSSIDNGNLGTISGFTQGDQINLTGTSFSAGDSLVSSGSVVSIVNGGTTIASFNTITGETITFTSGPNGQIEIICFLAGTHIATPKGEVEVQTLLAGDMVLTASGAAKPVRWLGQSTVSTRFANPLRSAPIRISAGALGENLPIRDLLVSPAHAMFVNGVLVEAGAMVNGTTIRREVMNDETFTYYHVELEAHDLIVAEGAVCESFIDNVDRMNFDNWSARDAAELPMPMVEMEYTRAKSARQVPQAIREHLESRAVLLADMVNAA